MVGHKVEAEFPENCFPQFAVGLIVSVIVGLDAVLIGILHLT